MKNINFNGKNKSLAIFGIFMIIVIIVLFMPSENEREADVKTDMGSVTEETYKEGLSKSEERIMLEENASKSFYIYSSQTGDWEEIGLLGDNKYTYIITEDNRQVKNCTGFYDIENDEKIIMGYGGKYHEGTIKGDTLHIFDKDYVRMDDSHM